MFENPPKIVVGNNREKRGNNDIGNYRENREINDVNMSQSLTTLAAVILH